MPPIFIGAEIDDTARFPVSPPTVQPLRIFEVALAARDEELRQARVKLARRLRAYKANTQRRMQRKIEAEFAKLASATLASFENFESKCRESAQSYALTALKEFLETPELAPTLQRRLRMQVEQVLNRLPHRFVQLRVNSHQEISAPPGIELVKDSDIPSGCAKLIGRSGAILLDWRANFSKERCK